MALLSHGRISRAPGLRLRKLLGLLLASAVFLGVHQVLSFVSSRPAADRRCSLPRAASSDDEASALLAQAEALREEAMREEEELKASRKAGEGEAAAEQGAADPAVAAAARSLAEARRNLEEASNKQRAAGAAVPTPAPGEDPRLAAASAELEAARRRAAGEAVPVAAATPSSPPSASTASFDDVKANYSGGKPWSQEKWEELAKKDMDPKAQFDLNMKIGAQGRRKLSALREGKSGVFILVGERVQLLGDEAAFKNSFGRFKDQVNGFSVAKAAKRGEECIVEAIFNDNTMTCVFPDSSRFDFPFESVEGWEDDGFGKGFSFPNPFR